MNIECPHCGANCPVEEKQFARESRVQIDCTQCHSNFAVNVPTDGPRLSADLTVALAVIEGPARGQVFRLTKARSVLGRSGADIVLYDPEVSRKHCMIEVRGSTGTLIDLGTTNGTFVAGKSIKTYNWNIFPNSASALPPWCLQLRITKRVSPLRLLLW